MRNKTETSLHAAGAMLSAFVLWTLALCVVDVQAIGPEGSSVGFATHNQAVHSITGVNPALYMVTDWLGLVPLCFAAGFGALGLAQWIRRKSLWKVDFSILALGGFYIALMLLFVFFETVVINYRPVLTGGVLEASYPSSTTLLVLCIMPTALLQFRTRIQNPMHLRIITFAIRGFTLFMVVGRLLSGVHWLSDILGGLLLSTGLVMLYQAVVEIHKTL